MERSAYEFHIARAARDRYGFADPLFSLTANVVLVDLAASRELAHRMNTLRDADRHPDLVVHPGALNAMGILDEVTHLVLALYRERRDPRAVLDALRWLETRIGRDALDTTLLAFADRFPTTAVYRGLDAAGDWLARETGGIPHRAIALEELITVWLANLNPAFRPFRELFDADALAKGTAYRAIGGALHEYFESRPRFGPAEQNLIDMLRAPALASPDSLEGQLEYIRRHWADLLGDFLRRLLRAMDVLKEEQVAIWLRFHPPGPRPGTVAAELEPVAAVPSYAGQDAEIERFSHDEEWMARTVLVAKSTYVWLDQLSRVYGRAVTRLDQIPDEELAALARRGFNALWLIGLWERSRASQRIKRLCGNPEAVASAYSLHDYAIATDLGGAAAYEHLRDRARTHGIRLASDMVPNHMGVDSRWVIEHPERFLSLPASPFTAYRFDGPNVADDDRVEIKIEDHYYDRSDAAVVFRRLDWWAGDARFIYHGNDGTSFPWNDTAQLDFTRADVREAVIRTILRVAHDSPIIRFDAAMTLAKRHFQRLWFPEPGTGGAIPSRAERGLSRAEFDALMPVEFWREVVDRVASEAPGTLLLAEAFWLMEGYFVRTLGMHRVYNSAFMHMLRDEDNAGYRRVMKDTLEFDPEILKRYVNFMSNPDEKTAVEQYGKGDKYFGVATLMATLPGLPMLGHGQLEGFGEKYGMEFRRAAWGETPDEGLVAAHERLIAPILHRRGDYAEVRDFLLYDVVGSDGHVRDDVFAYSNGSGGSRSLVVYHNRFAETEGWIRESSPYAVKQPDGSKHQVRRTLAQGLGLPDDGAIWLRFRDSRAGLEYLRSVGEVRDRGLHVSVRAYETSVFGEFRELADPAGIWGRLAEGLGGRGVPSPGEALLELWLNPTHDAVRAAVADPALDGLVRHGRSTSDEGLRRAIEPVVVAVRDATSTSGDVATVTSLAAGRLARLAERASSRAGRDGQDGHHRQGASSAIDAVAAAFTDPWHRAVLASWSILEALGRLAAPAMAGPTARAWFDELRLGPVLATALRDRGLDEAQAWAAAERVRSLLAVM